MLRFAAIGLDHRHIYDQVEQLQREGAVCVGHCPRTSDPRVLDGFRERFPNVPAVERRRLLEEPSIDFVCIAAVPGDRAALAIDAMRLGKDVMVDKPGVTTLEDLAALQACVADTGRIFSICFSERFIVPAVELATQLVAQGEIGRVVQTTGLGPHRLNRAIRPSWFFDPRRYGGILVDIASHQIDQFLHFTGSDDAHVVSSGVANFALPDVPMFEDYGELLLHGNAGASSASTGSRPTACRPGVMGAWFCWAPKASSSCASTSTSPVARAPTTCSSAIAPGRATSTRPACR